MFKYLEVGRLIGEVNYLNFVIGLNVKLIR